MAARYSKIICPNCAGSFLAEGSDKCPSCDFKFKKSFDKILAGIASLKLTDSKKLTPDEQTRLLEKNLKQITAKNFEDAAALTGFLLFKDLGDHAGLQKLGALYYTNKKDALAILCYKKAVALEGDNADYKEELGKIFLDVGNFTEAERVLKEAISLDSQSAYSYFYLAKLHEQKHEFTESAKHYIKAAILNPSYIKSLNNIIEEPIKIDEIERFFEEERKQYPDNVELYLGVGSVLLSHDENEKAEALLQHALKNTGAHKSNLIMQLAKLYKKQNNHEKVEALYKSAIQTNQNDVETLREIGKYYKKEKKFSEAVQYFQKIIALNPKESNAVYEAKECYKNLEQYEEAIGLMEAYQEAEPTHFNWAMHHVLELVYYCLKEDERVCRLVEEHYINNKKHAPETFVFDYYGYSLSNLGRTDEAIEAFRKSIDMSPKNARLMRELGKTYCDLEKYEEAIEVLTRSFSIEEKNSFGFYYLALAYHRLGKTDQAMKVLKKGREYDPKYKWFDDLLEEIDPSYQRTETEKPAEEKADDTEQFDKVESDTEKVALKMPNFLYDMTRLAKEGNLDDIIGREHELEEMIEVLCRRSKANAMVIGQAGVGKSVLVNGLAHRMARGEVPGILQDFKLLKFEVFAAVAGTRYVGTLEQKFLQLMNYVKQNKVILFIDEFHTLMGAGSYSSHETGGLDELFKPFLAMNQFKMIGATTDDEYYKHVAKNEALERRFTVVNISEPSMTETIAILKGLVSKLQVFYKVNIPEDIILNAVNMSAKYVKNRNLPDKACDILERASIKASLQKKSDDESKSVDINHIVQSICQITNLPAKNIHIDSMSGLLSLEDVMSSRVIGQDEAIKRVAEVIRMTKSELDVNPERPDGVFLFIGPTGVGKTELAKALAEALEGSDKRLARIDMSEYNDQYAVSKLIGTTAGYVGYSEDGILTKTVRENPSAVILLDEIEKAHASIFTLFLQVFDDGRLTDGKGNSLSFSHNTFIMTSNLGAEVLYGKQQMGFAKAEDDFEKEVGREIRAELQKFFSPEFLNRLDEIIIFHPLDADVLKMIAKQKIGDILKRFETKGYDIKVDDAVVDLFLAGLDVKREGARGINRAVENYVSRPLSKTMIKNLDCKSFNITRDAGEVVVTRGM